MDIENESLPGTGVTTRTPAGGVPFGATGKTTQSAGILKRSSRLPEEGRPLESNMPNSFAEAPIATPLLPLTGLSAAPSGSISTGLYNVMLLMCSPAGGVNV